MYNRHNRKYDGSSQVLQKQITKQNQTAKTNTWGSYQATAENSSYTGREQNSIKKSSSGVEHKHWNENASLKTTLTITILFPVSLCTNNVYFFLEHTPFWELSWEHMGTYGNSWERLGVTLGSYSWELLELIYCITTTNIVKICKTGIKHVRNECRCCLPAAKCTSTLAHRIQTREIT